MALGAGQIKTARDDEWKATRKYWESVKFETLKLKQVTIAGVQVKIRGESANDLKNRHNESIKHAVTDVVAAGYNLPPLDFYLCSNDNIPNVAMKTYDTSGNPTPIIFLGPKMWSKNPMSPGTANLIAGGLGAGKRGIADQAYDGTTRFFGNPKSKAQGVTIVIHELGHILHEIANPGVFWEELEAALALRPSPNANGWQNASIEVSNYAGNNSLEFVAEVFAGRLIGKTYSTLVNNTYGALGGP